MKNNRKFDNTMDVVLIIAACTLCTILFLVSLKFFGFSENEKFVNIMGTTYVILIFGLTGGGIFYKMFYELNKKMGKSNDDFHNSIKSLLNKELQPTILFKQSREELQGAVARTLENLLDRNNQSDFIRFYGSGSLQPKQDELEHLEASEKKTHGAPRYSNAFSNYLDPDKGIGTIHRYVRLFPDEWELNRNPDLKSRYHKWILSQADLIERNSGRYYFTAIERAPEYSAPISYIATSTSLFILFGPGQSGMEIRGENIALRCAKAIQEYFSTEPGDTKGVPYNAVSLRAHAKKFAAKNNLDVET